MARIDVDSTLWPLVIVKLPQVVTDDEVREYLAQLRAFRERREPYALIIDANDSRGFTANQRKLQAEYIQEGIALSRKYLRAFAFVAASTFQRGMLTAIFWLQRPEWPHQVFKTLDQAKAWTRYRIYGTGDLSVDGKHDGARGSSLES